MEHLILRTEKQQMLFKNTANKTLMSVNCLIIRSEKELVRWHSTELQEL